MTVIDGCFEGRAGERGLGEVVWQGKNGYGTGRGGGEGRLLPESKEGQDDSGARKELW